MNTRDSLLLLAVIGFCAVAGGMVCLALFRPGGGV